MKPTEKLSSILTRGGLSFVSCFLGRHGSCYVVCASDAAARKVASLLHSATFTVRGITEGRKANKKQFGTRLVESHSTHTVHAKL